MHQELYRSRKIPTRSLHIIFSSHRRREDWKNNADEYTNYSVRNSFKKPKVNLISILEKSDLLNIWLAKMSESYVIKEVRKRFEWNKIWPTNNAVFQK